MSLNLDIWFEILQYFSYPEDKDTFRSLATASRHLSELALGRIWRDGKSAVDIVSMINSFAPSPSKPYLVFEKGPGRDTRESGDEGPIVVGEMLSRCVSFSRLEFAIIRSRN